MGDDFEPVASAAVVQVWRWGDGHRVLSNERDMNFSERTSSQRLCQAMSKPARLAPKRNNILF
jgi:hypothetical protein